MKMTCKELKRIARTNLTDKYKTPMGAMVAILLISLLIDLPFSSLLTGKNTSLFQDIIYYISDFLIAILTSVFQMGLLRLHLNLARKEKYAVSDIFFCFKNQTDRYIIANTIMISITTLCMAPSFIARHMIKKMPLTTENIAIILTLCIVSIIATIMFAIRYCLVSYIMLDNPEIKPTAAFKQSRLLVKGNFFRILYIYLSFIGISIPVVLSLGIGLLWVKPYIDQTLVILYLDLCGETKKDIAVNNSPYDYSSFNQYI